MLPAAESQNVSSSVVGWILAWNCDPKRKRGLPKTVPRLRFGLPFYLFCAIFSQIRRLQAAVIQTYRREHETCATRIHLAILSALQTPNAACGGVAVNQVDWECYCELAAVA